MFQVRARITLLFFGVCLCIPASLVFGQSAVVDERRAELERTLARIEQEIAVQQTLLDGKRGERVSLERDIAILDAEIAKARLQVQARTLAIQRLTGEIGNRAETIDELSERLRRERESLAQIIRTQNAIGNATVVELILGTQNVSEFFQDLDTFSSLKTKLSESFDTIETTRASTEEEKTALESRRIQETELRALQQLEQRKIEEREKEKQRILNATRGEESAYQRLLSSSQQTAAQIRAELFALRDSAAIPFGLAYELAEKAGAATGVRPALILGILKQETRLGENIGTGTWKADMHPARDQPVFGYITQVLGVDPNMMPVSKKPSYGWGGAMGPSQFIPSTWVCYGGLINTNTGDCNNSKRSMSWDAFWQGPWEYRADKDRIRVALKSNRISNPWNNEDAFTATAMLMRDNGAASGTRSAERLAALRYFAGWANAENPSYAFYGDGVMQHTEEFQQMINILKGQ